ncbi:putative rRNA maturation factor [Acholeplasma morum]|jgi:probable rRNA maturation factor|uniref:rRNA maturation RNase YbeY n=1 Tax=Paracholeplasma morum TaxID=264637 RepID=UPI00195D71BF|nr:rRNA maturation RNase YbeY [Paracholeplasma morum]MBM7453555.1 putative rRNA maturation factor [Paracholeplasma morum]
MDITFYNQTEENTEQAEVLIKRIFEQVDTKEEMSVIFLTSDAIKTMNRDYRGIDKVTDVISFPDKEDDYIGDIFICLDRAKEQASDYNHSIEREIGFLSVHGYLHLLGYDHHTEEDEKVMFTKQEEILKKANLERVIK